MSRSLQEYINLHREIAKDPDKHKPNTVAYMAWKDLIQETIEAGLLHRVIQALVAEKIQKGQLLDDGQTHRAQDTDRTTDPADVPTAPR